MAKKQEIRKRALIQQLDATRDATKHPKELLGKQAFQGLTTRFSQQLGDKTRHLAYENPTRIAWGAGLFTLLVTLLLRRSPKKSRLLNGDGGGPKTIIKYLPERKKKSLSRKMSGMFLKFGWTLALPYLKTWATKEATRRVTHQVKTRATQQVRQRVSHRAERQS